MRNLRVVLACGLLLALGACEDQSGGDGAAVLPDEGTAILLSDAEVHDATPGLDAQPADAGPVPLDAATEDPDGDPPGDAEVVDAALPDAEPLPAVCLELPTASPQSPLDLGARCSEGGSLRIWDLRDARCARYEALPTQAPGRLVVLDEVVVTGVFGDHFTVSEPEGGAWAALYVYNGQRADISALRPGSRVRLRGQVIEYFTLTELLLDREDPIEILGEGAPIEPLYIADPSRLATGGDLAEPMESVLVALENLVVLDTAPDCPLDFGMFVVMGNLRIDDENDHGFEAARRDVIERAVGVVHYDFEETKLWPRGPEDLQTILCGGIPEKCETATCQVEADALETGRLIVTEIQNDPAGEDSEREFVELYNPGPSVVDLTGWTVEDCAGHSAQLSGTVAARSYHVIARSLNQQRNGGVRAQGDMGELFLPNTKGSVLVFDEQRRLVDQVRYDEVAPWPTRQVGRSLELMEPAADNSDGAAWAEATERYGEGGFGSPGRGWRP